MKKIEFDDELYNMETISDVCNYLEENNVDTSVNKLIYGDLVKDVERVRKYVNYSNFMNDLFEATNTYPYFEPVGIKSFSEEKVDELLTIFRLACNDALEGKINKKELESIIEDNKIYEMFFMINTYLIEEGYDIELSVISNFSLASVSDKSGFGIDEIIRYSELFDIGDYEEVIEYRMTYEMLDTNHELCKDDNDKYAFNAVSNDVLSSSYDDIVYYMVLHIAEMKKLNGRKLMLDKQE